jgi:hypothetical protein
MTRLISVMIVALAASSAACAPLYGTSARSYLRTPPAPPAVDVTGRWDNVMMLPPGARVHVLLMDGSRVEGDIVTASSGAVTLAVAAGEVEVSADRVARVDRTAASERVGRGLSGAAHSAGLVGVLGLLAGRVPPPRVFAAGAILGAEGGIHGGIAVTPQTVYVSPQLRR